MKIYVCSSLIMWIFDRSMFALEEEEHAFLVMIVSDLKFFAKEQANFWTIFLSLWPSSEISCKHPIFRGSTKFEAKLHWEKDYDDVKYFWRSSLSGFSIWKDDYSHLM